MSIRDWQKSSYSGTSANCVQVASGDDGTVGMRESDDPGTVLTTTPESLAAFIRGVKAGEFDHFLRR